MYWVTNECFQITADATHTDDPRRHDLSHARTSAVRLIFRVGWVEEYPNLLGYGQVN